MLIERLIEEKSGEIEYVDMQRLLNDVEDEYCKERLPYMLSVVPEAAEQFGDWDCNFTVDTNLPVLWHVWEIAYTE